MDMWLRGGKYSICAVSDISPVCIFLLNRHVATRAQDPIAQQTALAEMATVMRESSDDALPVLIKYVP